ncbi:uncharacterized protein LOC122537341, partial [Frieseomelitta varia]|uniref:uncharacterized protein LOC122537341 n=1 Tax=Frieseomelitta varia TaxID=561572 RepID=UPI001CB68B1D
MSCNGDTSDNFSSSKVNEAKATRTCSKRSKSDKDLAKSFAETFAYVVRQTKMDVDRKMKELKDLFAKTGEELLELVRSNEKFVNGEMQKVEEAVRKSTEVRAAGKMDRLRDVKDAYDEGIKICNKKAANALRAAKTACDQRIQEADALRGTMRQVLKECLRTNDFVKCIASETKEAVKQRKRISNELKETMKSAEASVAEQLQEVVKCHANARAEALRKLQKILKDTKDSV